jgi:amino acid transporter
MLGFLVGGVALVPVGYVYGRLTAQMPDASSEIAYTAAVFPAGVSFAVGWMMVLAYLIVCPWEAVAIGQVASYLFPQLNAVELYRVGDHPVYLPHVALGLALTAAITAINYRGIGLSARFQNLTVFGLLAVFVVFSALGLTRGTVANLEPLFRQDRSLVGGLISTLLVLQIVPYSLMGFETVPKCSEEAAADFNPRSFVRVILLSLGVGTFFYVAVIGVVALLQPWTTLTSESFATAVAFERAFGSPLLVQFILAGALLSLLKVFNGNFLAATRLLFALGRRGLVDKRFGTVHGRFSTPTYAILFAGSATALTALLGRAVLIPIMEVGSLAAVVGWLATCLAFCAGAGGVLTSRTRVVGLCGVVGTAALLVMKLLPIVPGSFGLYEFLGLAGWLALGLVLWLWPNMGRLR